MVRYARYVGVLTAHVVTQRSCTKTLFYGQHQHSRQTVIGLQHGEDAVPVAVDAYTHADDLQTYTVDYGRRITTLPQEVYPTRGPYSLPPVPSLSVGVVRIAKVGVSYDSLSPGPE